MSNHPRIESSDLASFLTTRTRNSRLWFINNRLLEEAVLAYAAKYSERYSVKLYALAIEGSHIQSPAHFPKANRAAYMRDFNSSIARAVPRYCPEYDGGLFWGRRYSSEFLPDPQDIENYFFYTVLQPVQDGLVERISDYPGYNCFNDAVRGIKREFRVTNWSEYNAKKRYDPTVRIRDFQQIVTLEYARLPGYEDLSKDEYVKLMHEKLEERRIAIVAERLKQGLGFVGREKLLMKRPGSYPHKTKKSDRYSHRPRVLCLCNERRAEVKAWYFGIYSWYKEASEQYRNGDYSVEFPPGTYKPYYGPTPQPPD